MAKHSEEKQVTFTLSATTLKLAAVLVIGLLVGYMAGSNYGGTWAGTTNNGNQAAPSGNDNNQGAAAQRVAVSTDDDPARGPKDAKVTIIEFSDFQCPFCQRAFTDAVAGIKRDYVDTGKVRFVYRDFPLSFHVNAQISGEASECADEQGKFWEMHDLLFTKGQADGTGLDSASLKQYAKDLGLDAAKFDSCLDTGKYKAEVQKDLADGSAAGVSGTPTFFIGNDKNKYQMIVGAQPYAVIKQAIEAELAR